VGESEQRGVRESGQEDVRVQQGAGRNDASDNGERVSDRQQLTNSENKMSTLLQRRLSLTADPKESDPKYKHIIEQARIEAEKECPGWGFARCHCIWAAQKRILKEKHNIDWKSPREMDPRVCVD